MIVPPKPGTAEVTYANTETRLEEVKCTVMLTHLFRCGYLWDAFDASEGCSYGSEAALSERASISRRRGRNAQRLRHQASSQICLPASPQHNITDRSRRRTRCAEGTETALRTQKFVENHTSWSLQSSSLRHLQAENSQQYSGT